MILVIHAHPYPGRSRAGRALVEAVRTLPEVEVRSLYDLYPDFDIDVAGEQAALARADLVVWLHPLYWYSVPGLLKHWFDKVLERGWAYGNGGRALAGKRVLWVPTVGGASSTYESGQSNLKPFSSYVDPIRQTACFCGMTWEDPLIVFGSRTIEPAELATCADRLRARLQAYLAGEYADAAKPGNADSAEAAATGAGQHAALPDNRAFGAGRGRIADSGERAAASATAADAAGAMREPAP